MTEAVLPHPRENYGLSSWLTTVDHKRIGILYGVTAVVFACVGGIEAMLIRTQLIVPNNTFLSPDLFNAMFTMHGTTMIFMFVMPLNAAFFNYIVPLQIGARDVAFPRLNALSYWVFLFGGLLFHLSFVTGHLPEVGWFGYANITTKQFTPGPEVGLLGSVIPKGLQYPVSGTEFWIVGLQLLGLASLIASINFIVTILNLRAPGMTPMRMPLFTWVTLITNFLLLLALPVITVALFQILLDRHFGTRFYDIGAGGTVMLWQHLFWVFGHPEVYILILPPMGMVSEVLPTFSRKPLFGYPAMVYASAAIAFLGFSVWAHHMFTTGMGAMATAIFSAATMLIAIPTGVKIFNWISTMWGGSLRMTTAMWFAVGFLAEFTIGGLSGIMHASPPIDGQHQDTYFVVAHFHYVLFGGSVFGLFAGLYYWFPKFSGRLLSEPIGKVHFWLTAIGFNLTFFPMHFLGVDGMPRRIYTYAPGFNLETWNFWSSIGAYITLLSALVFFYNVFVSLRGRQKAPADPWDARTLEWAIASPPPAYNFASLPDVQARDDFWYRKHEAKTFKPEPEHVHVVLPNPSYWPLIVGAGITLMGAGFLFAYVLTFIGVAVTLVGAYGWSFAKFEG
ncbi:MAG: cytochrome c oxidase subunit I [Candidatus Lambdaproteobacteria bacterium]|nr:cytochrome c oxidase subunit I [Candidatus Lambdaproteobacteria bacterium]